MNLPRLTFCMTIGLDALSLWVSSFHTNNASMLSRGEMDVTGSRRVLDVLDRFDIKSTLLVPGHTAHAYPNLIREIRDRGTSLRTTDGCTKTHATSISQASV